MKRQLLMYFHGTIGLVVVWVKEAWFGRSLRNLEDGLYEVYPKPPYISQLANASKDKIDEFYGGINDQVAAIRFGTTNIADFSYWAWRSCGIVCLQMVLTAQVKNNFGLSTMDLINEGLSLGGYNVGMDIGWYHSVLAKIGEKHGMKGVLVRFVTASQIARLVLDGNYVLASIKSNKGGHLLLIHGVNLMQGKIGSFIVHDPNDFRSRGDSKEISKLSFEKLSKGRIIVFKGKEIRQVD